jgi:hypothetical protein
VERIETEHRAEAPSMALLEQAPMAPVEAEV